MDCIRTLISSRRALALAAARFRRALRWSPHMQHATSVILHACYNALQLNVCTRGDHKSLPEPCVERMSVVPRRSLHPACSVGHRKLNPPLAPLSSLTHQPSQIDLQTKHGVVVADDTDSRICGGNSVNAIFDRLSPKKYVLNGGKLTLISRYLISN